MADKKKMSVAEILAAARKADGGAADEAAPEKPEQPSSPEQTESEQQKPAAKPSPPSGGSGGRPSVAEMMAMARAEKDKSKQAEKPAAPKASAPKKPAAKAAAKKPAAKAESKAKPTGPRDTASILAAARSTSKPGPVSKSEAAAKGGVEAKRAKPAPAKAKPVVPPRPEKSAYVKAKPEAEPARRSFLLGALFGSFLAVGFTSLAATTGLWTVGIVRFMFPNVLREPPSQFKVGFPGDFAPGQVETKYKAQFGIWVVRTEYKGQMELFALKSVCTHLGCTPNWLEGEQKFKCPCHGSGFYKDGINFEGPAPRPLERYAISLADDGQVLVDKSRTFQEEMGAWEDSASYIA